MLGRPEGTGRLAGIATRGPGATEGREGHSGCSGAGRPAGAARPADLPPLGRLVQRCSHCGSTMSSSGGNWTCCTVCNSNAARSMCFIAAITDDLLGQAAGIRMSGRQPEDLRRTVIGLSDRQLRISSRSTVARPAITPRNRSRNRRDHHVEGRHHGRTRVCRRRRAHRWPGHCKPTCQPSTATRAATWRPSSWARRPNGRSAQTEASRLRIPGTRFTPARRPDRSTGYRVGPAGRHRPAPQHASSRAATVQPHRPRLRRVSGTPCHHPSRCLSGHSDLLVLVQQAGTGHRIGWPYTMAAR